MFFKEIITSVSDETKTSDVDPVSCFNSTKQLRIHSYLVSVSAAMKARHLINLLLMGGLYK